MATLIGLAVRIKDPENILGRGEDLGITCVLCPSSTPGVVLGRRHNPMGIPFFNCPTSDKDVVLSVEQVIGGAEGIGRGWQMLMECLAAGRSISLPSQSAGGVKGLMRVVSAYSVVRRQFGVAIGQFEGIEEPMARIVGLGYLMEAVRIYTAGAVDSGLKPAVVSAIAKFTQTELARKLVNDAMDIMGGAGISRGPRNRVANGYIGAPIAITVEGANILTRSMIIFGQGAIRCHPFAYKEVKALMAKDYAAFDAAFWGHVGHVIRNGFRAILLSLSRGYLASVPAGPGSNYCRKLAWASATFAIWADIAMGTLGGTLKLREKLTGRYADILSWMYLASATLKRFEAEGRKPEDRDAFDWAMQYCLARIQEGFDGIFANFKLPVVGGLVCKVLGIWSRVNQIGRDPEDRLGHRLAQAIQKPGSFRDRLTDGIVVSSIPGDASDRLEEAFRLAHESEKILGKIAAAVKRKALPKKRAPHLVKEALAANIITQDEAKLLERTIKSHEEVIQVDSFALDEFRSTLLDMKAAPAK
ncbi:hypothetical protein E3A20_00280 [Planctomyces bekefii]|uniref:Acyl-coenzyme A dehydrogenase n=1 Tax=Planctomyces bekefii TaxID=1653850 RepID=A0A5C6MEG5_9PLAN|nr:hypothetical protein E3A20_00280 [Planctomyces bekefii]